MLFLLSGGTVAWTVALEPGGGESRVLLLGFAALVSTSGVLCFLLERDWSHGLSRSAKVPLYALLGVSLSFSTHFTALDLYGKLREVMGCDNSGGASPTIVRTRWQARLLALVAVVTGCMYDCDFNTNHTTTTTTTTTNTNNTNNTNTTTNTTNAAVLTL